MPTDDSTGARLRAIREALGLSQQEVAARIGKSQQWIGNHERGLVRTPPEHARLIAGAMGYRAELLIAPGGAMDRLLDGLAMLQPEHVEDVADLVALLPVIHPDARDMVTTMIRTAAQKARTQTQEGATSRA